MNEKMTQNVSSKSDDDEIDILEILVYLKSKWKFLLIFLILGIVFGGFFQKRHPSPGEC